MASLRRAFKPPPNLAPLARPRRPARAPSTSASSDASGPSSVASEEQQFVVSGCNTPALPDKSPGWPNSDGPAMAWPALPDIEISHATVPVFSTTETHSRPIAIEIPGLRKASTAPVYTPPEPLSARGDIPGGYFPLHEDPKPRVHRPHPFHQDAKRARNQSISQAAESAELLTDLHAAHAVMLSEPGPVAVQSSASSASSRTDTPVASYMPTGSHGSPLPVGKYYPSNYEMRNSGPNSPKKQPRASAKPAFPAKSDSHVPTYRNDSKHARTDSEAKRRLQQYQRDMVAQAAQAASQVLGANLRLGNSTLASNTSSLHAVAMTKIQLKTSMVQKPVSPRLIPLGSPGPVTPMELEDDAEGFLTRGRPLSSPDAEREIEEISRAIRAEQECRRRNGAGSPAIDMGPVSA